MGKRKKKGRKSGRKKKEINIYNFGFFYFFFVFLQMLKKKMVRDAPQRVMVNLHIQKQKAMCNLYYNHKQC